MELTDWLLTSRERGNGATRLDSRRSEGTAWSSGNQVRPLVHGAAYFPELLSAIRAQRAGDLPTGGATPTSTSTVPAVRSAPSCGRRPSAG